MAKVLFTAAEDEKFVEWVASYPCLYDAHLPTYKNQKIKDSAWKEISLCIKKSEDECRKRWKNIKDTYNRRKNKGKGTGSSAVKQKWLLADMLGFLEETEYKRQSKSNIEGNDNSHIEETEMVNSETETLEQNSNPSISESTQIPVSVSSFKSTETNKRQKLNAKIFQLMEDRQKERTEIFKKLSNTSEDDIDVFFKSIAMSVRKMPPNLVNEAKMRSLQLVFELQQRATISASEPLLSPGQESTSSSNTSYVYSPPPVFIPLNNEFVYQNLVTGCSEKDEDIQKL